MCRQPELFYVCASYRPLSGPGVNPRLKHWTGTKSPGDTASTPLDAWASCKWACIVQPGCLRDVASVVETDSVAQAAKDMGEDIFRSRQVVMSHDRDNLACLIPDVPTVNTFLPRTMLQAGPPVRIHTMVLRFHARTTISQSRPRILLWPSRHHLHKALALCLKVRLLLVNGVAARAAAGLPVRSCTRIRSIAFVP